MQRGKKVTPLVTAPGDTNFSDATVLSCSVDVDTAYRVFALAFLLSYLITGADLIGACCDAGVMTGGGDDCEKRRDGGDCVGREHSTVVHVHQRRCIEPGSRWTSLAAAAAAADDDDDVIDDKLSSLAKVV